MESSQYCRLPVGVTNGVSCFQRIIDSVFADDELKQTFAYLDNINISGFDKADHDHNLKMFLDSASKINLTFNDAKFLVAVAEVDVLGYRISQGSIRPDPEHLRLLIELPMHKSSKELKRCLGMFAYYARWIRHFSGKMKPLIAGKVHIPLQSDAVAAFESLLEEPLSACLKFIGENEPFTVHCDASDFAIAPSSVKVNDLLLSCHAPCRKVSVTTTQSKRMLLRSTLCGSGVTIYTVARSHK